MIRRGCQYFASMRHKIGGNIFESPHSVPHCVFTLFTSFNAESEGFEPSRALRPCLVSSEVLSTTQPTLRIFDLYLDMTTMSSVISLGMTQSYRFCSGCMIFSFRKVSTTFSNNLPDYLSLVSSEVFSSTSFQSDTCVSHTHVSTQPTLHILYCVVARDRKCGRTSCRELE